MKEVIRRGLYLIFLLLFAQVAHCQGVIRFEGIGQENIGREVAIFRDTLASYSFEEVSSKEFDQRFQPSKMDNLNFPDIDEDEAIWVKFTINKTFDGLCLLTVGEWVLDSLTLYRTNDTSLEPITVGKSLPRGRHGYSTNRFVFLLDPPLGVESTYFLRVKSMRLQFPLFITSTQLWTSEVHIKHLIDGIYYGFILLMFVYNGFLYFSTKDKAYSAYLVYLVTAGLYVAWVNGDIAFWLGNNMLFIHDYGPAIGCLSTFGCILFSKVFLQTHKHFKLGDTIINGLMILMAVPIVVNILGHQYLASKLLTYSALVSFLFLYYAGIVVWRKYSFARFYLVAWFFFLGFMMVYILKTLGVLPLNIVTANAKQIGSSLEMCFFALALADRINSYREKISLSELELRGLNKELLIQNKSLEEYSHMLSHNMRAPIASLLGMVRMYNHKDPEDSFNEVVVSKSLECAERLDQVVHDLNSSLLSSKKTTLEREQIHLPGLIERITSGMHHEVTRSRMKLLTNFQVKDFVSNYLFLYGVMERLFSNALKFRDPERRLVVEVETYQEANELVLVIQDNGLGMDMERHGHKLFRIYQRFHHHVEGKGVGLHMVRSQVEALGGRIVVDSQEGEGFRVELRLRLDAHHVEHEENFAIQ